MDGFDPAEWQVDDDDDDDELEDDNNTSNDVVMVDQSTTKKKKKRLQDLAKHAVAREQLARVRGGYNNTLCMQECIAGGGTVSYCCRECRCGGGGGGGGGGDI